ncbi:MAG: SCO family protein [Chitinophagales bacterium]|nr:SCO family protein [Chitinophagales bacterium]
MKTLHYFLAVAFLMISCQQNNNSKVKKDLPSNSIFQLSSEWQNQDGKTVHLKDLQGKTLVVVMIYTTCKTACPVLVSKMQLIESKISRQDIKDVSMVLVSIDPETDTPEFLKDFAIKNNMDAPQWVFLRSNEAATQEFANVLSMKYKKISPMDFSHSNIISIFNPQGQLIMQDEGLEIDVDKIVNTVHGVLKG